QLRAGPELPDEDRDEIPDGGLLHQADERLEASELQSLAAAVIVGPGGREAHVERRAEADAGDQHAPADVPEETPTRALCSHRRPFRWILRRARRHCMPGGRARRECWRATRDHRTLPGPPDRRENKPLPSSGGRSTRS